MEPVFFVTAAEWRAWLEANHACATELAVGFWKVGSGRPSMTWPQSVDEALCFGWIDGVRHRIDDDSYRIRFTPRKAGGIWSRANIRRFGELEAEGRVTPAGRAAFETGRENTGRYSFEQGEIGFTAEEEALFRADAAAWDGFQARPPSYRRPATWWVVSAKRPETRASRLATLIRCSAAGENIPTMKWWKGS